MVALLARPELRLRPVVRGDPRRPVEWVHVSELDDPTECRTGGELLLTTGVRGADTPEHWDAYVQRLVVSDVVAVHRQPAPPSPRRPRTARRCVHTGWLEDWLGR